MSVGFERRGATMMPLDVVADIYNARNEHLDDAPAVELAAVSIHMGGARRAGASDAEIIEAIACAFPVTGVSALVEMNKPKG